MPNFAGLLITGNEILLGRILDTNSAWLGQKLLPAGWRISHKMTVPDGNEIGQEFAHLLNLAKAGKLSAIFISGGLGPTSDDITRDEIAKQLGQSLLFSEEAHAVVSAAFTRMKRPMSQNNLRQAQVIPNSHVLQNPHGTAPGLWIPANSFESCPVDIFLLPGPPNEFRPMVETSILPILKNHFPTSAQEILEIKIEGIGESLIHAKLENDFNQLQLEEPSLEIGYCARPGEVDVRLIGSKIAVTRAQMIVCSAFGENIANDNGASLAETLVEKLSQFGQSISTVESCTGGMIAKSITDVSGASNVFGWGWVSYANEAKEGMVHVPHLLLEKFGAVSPEVASAMATGALTVSNSNWAISVTGIAGPTGGSASKPVGTVYIAIAQKISAKNEIEVTTYKEFFPYLREIFRERVTRFALWKTLQKFINL